MTTVRPSRGALAQALADVVEASPELAAAITVFEAWRPGYASDLVAAAEMIADHFSLSGLDEASVAVAAVEQAVAEANPKAVLRRIDITPAAGAVEAAVALTQAQARFHLLADGLERRTHARYAMAS